MTTTPTPTPVPPVVESWVVKAERALTKLGAVAGFVASLVATAKGALPTDVGTAATVVTGGIYFAEHHWAEVKAWFHSVIHGL